MCVLAPLAAAVISSCWSLQVDVKPVLTHQHRCCVLLRLTLGGHPRPTGNAGVKLAAAKVVKDAASGTATLVGFAQTPSDNVEAVLAHCRARLVPAMVPSIIVAVEAFLMLPNGKLDYNRLPDVDLSAAVSGAASGGEVVLPRTKLEEVVAEAWSAVLKVLVTPYCAH